MLKSREFNGFIDLSVKKKRVASTKARFCTEELKTKPMIDYVLSLQEDVMIYQGVRSDESIARSVLKMKDEYFKFYYEPYGFDKKGRPKYHTYRKKDVFAFCDKYSVDVFRPIIKWNANQVFNYIFSNDLKPNELYFEGFSRVGCFPCVQCRHTEIKLIAKSYPDRIDAIRNLEKSIGRTFFPPKYIPPEYCSIRTVNKKGKVSYVPTIDDVVKYVSDDKNQVELYVPEPCLSVYNICDKS
ncbi:hypothetical protein D3C80_677050 [compost metagenome]